LPWEGEAKHRLNKGQILLLEQHFKIYSTDLIHLHSDNNLLQNIKTKMAGDKEMQDILGKLWKGE
jgi:hypothetical protein